MRSFDPRRVGELECAMWVAYYRREWWRLLRCAVAMVRESAGLGWPTAAVGAWLILRANRRWAPPHDDPEGARRAMRRFYALVARRHGERFDVQRAAWLEVEWWRVHRERKHAPDAERELVDALVALNAHLYGVASVDLVLAARQRALAMGISDRWVAEGCPADSALLAQERAALVRSYAALLAAVHVA